MSGNCIKEASLKLYNTNKKKKAIKGFFYHKNSSKIVMQRKGWQTWKICKSVIKFEYQHSQIVFNEFFPRAETENERKMKE